MSQSTDLQLKIESEEESEITRQRKATIRMALYAAGILGSLIVYGLLQERIITRPYGDEGAKFKSSAYLVFNNRVVAVIIAMVLLLRHRETFKNQAPLLSFAGVSVSNTIATFCQYEALKYVSFPTQTLGKCGKMIPVMILGFLLGGKKYTMKDFGIAALVTLGCVMFVLTGDISGHASKDDSFYGLILMGCYLLSDGFTSTTQEKLLRGLDVSEYNQMLYVNSFSVLISLSTLIFNNELWSSLTFSYEHPDFFFNSLFLSLASSFGQLIILWTIKEFGALFFATVMTVRQVFSIIISCIIFLHPLSYVQWLSAALVFGVLYYKDTSRKPHAHHAPPPPAQNPTQTEESPK